MMPAKGFYPAFAVYLVVSTAALGQSSVDLETLAKGDALRAQAKTAPAAQLPAILQRFGALVKTDGLSKTCRTALIAMQSAASATVPEEALDDMPDAMKATLKAQSVDAERKIDADRAACLKPPQGNAQPVMAETAPQGKPAAKIAEAGTGGGDAALPIQERLTKLHERAKSAFQDKSRSGLEEVNMIVGQLAKQKDYDMSCRLAASSMMREIKYYNNYLNATDPDMQKIASAGIKLAASSVERSLSECE